MAKILLERLKGNFGRFYFGSSFKWKVIIIHKSAWFTPLFPSSTSFQSFQPHRIFMRVTCKYRKHQPPIEFLSHACYTFSAITLFLKEHFHTHIVVVSQYMQTVVSWMMCQHLWMNRLLYCGRR